MVVIIVIIVVVAVDVTISTVRGILLPGATCDLCRARQGDVRAHGHEGQRGCVGRREGDQLGHALRLRLMAPEIAQLHSGIHMYLV